MTAGARTEHTALQHRKRVFAQHACAHTLSMSTTLFSMVLMSLMLRSFTVLAASNALVSCHHKVQNKHAPCITP